MTMMTTDVKSPDDYFDNLIWEKIIGFTDNENILYSNKFFWFNCIKDNVRLEIDFFSNIYENDNAKLLLKACEKGKTELAQYLLNKSKFDIDASTLENFLWVAQSKCHSTNYLIDKSKWDGSTIDNSRCIAQIKHYILIAQSILNIFYNTPDLPINDAFVHAADSNNMNMVRLLLNRPKNPPHVTFKSLICAVWNSNAEMVLLLLEHGVRAYGECGEALVIAAGQGQENIARLLLESQYPPSANCQNGEALTVAATSGNENMVRLLLEWPIHAPRANIENGQAFIEAVEMGHENIARLLLEWPIHAPRADCQKGQALISAAKYGYLNIVRLLLNWPNHAPKANCQNGKALRLAIENGHENIARLLLEWPIHAPRADCQKGQALISAAKYGYLNIVRLLLNWPNHAPKADCQNGKALRLAIENGHETIATLLREAAS